MLQIETASYIRQYLTKSFTLLHKISKSLLKHQQTTHTAVTVLKGMDSLYDIIPLILSSVRPMVFVSKMRRVCS